jgi:hypothetical protein
MRGEPIGRRNARDDLAAQSERTIPFVRPPVIQLTINTSEFQQSVEISIRVDVAKQV